MAIEYNTDPAQQGNRQHRYEVTQADLPLACPLPKFRLWDSHPRVYLPLDKTGKVVCPYCEAEYVLVDDHNDLHHQSS